jgi:hypothetical protein
MARTARTAAAAASAPAAPAVETFDPNAAATVTESADGTVTITFRTDRADYPLSESRKSRTVAKVGYAVPFRTKSGIVVQLNAYRIVPKAERA